MERYNLTVRLVVNAGVNAESPEAAKTVMASLLDKAVIVQIGGVEFVVEDTEVTGVYDTDWNEV